MSREVYWQDPRLKAHPIDQECLAIEPRSTRRGQACGSARYFVGLDNKLEVDVLGFDRAIVLPESVRHSMWVRGWQS